MERRPHIIEEYSESEELTSTEDGGLTEDEPSVHSVDRAVPSIRRARHEVFDGVYPPTRDAAKARAGAREMPTRSTEGKENVKGKLKENEASGSGPAAAKPKRQSSPGLPPSSPRKSPRAVELPELTPVEARKVCFDTPEDVRMTDVGDGEKKTHTPDQPKAPATSSPGTPAPIAGRQSELSATVDRHQVMERILDVQIPLSIREIMVTSKDLRTEFQDLIKVKNIRAALLSEAQEKDILSAVSWPRGDGVLIQVECKAAAPTLPLFCAGPAFNLQIALIIGTSLFLSSMIPYITPQHHPYLSVAEFLTLCYSYTV